MSLSTQLIRGLFALPLLFGFALLALSQDASSCTPPQIKALIVATPAMCAPEPRHATTLKFAGTPADLGELSMRWRQSCRA